MGTFKNYSEMDVARHNAAVAGLNHSPVGENFESESKLHSRVFDECRSRGWIPFHGAMSERTHRTSGEPDFIVLANKGRVFFVECKSKTGKVTPEQNAIIHWANMLGHTIHVIRTIEELLEIVKEPSKEVPGTS